MFEEVLLRPIFNLLLGIFSILPGHDFGVAIIIFTLLVKLALWPRTKKQFISSRKIRDLQPEMKKLKEKHKDDKRAQQVAVAELYKRNGVSPLAAFGNLFIQIPIIIALFSAVRVFSGDNNVADISRRGYGFIKDTDFVQGVIGREIELEQSFLGIIDLSRVGFGDGSLYMPLILVSIISAGVQFMQTRQMTASTDGSSRSLRDILKAEAKGEQASQSEITAATTKSMTMLMPGLTLFLGVTFPGAVAFYWMVSNIISFIQQRMVSRSVDDEPKVTVKYSSVGDKDKGSSKTAKTTKKKTANKAAATKKKSSSKSKKRRK